MAEKKVEELSRGKLEARFPEEGFVGEETGGSRGGAAGQAVWVVDPIDGTACFLGGMPTWCVSIALVMNGEIEIGVIHDPNVDEPYAARRGGGTFLNGKRQPVPPGRSVKDGLLGPGFSRSADARVGREGVGTCRLWWSPVVYIKDKRTYKNK